MLKMIMKTFLPTRKKVYQHLIAKKASIPLKNQNKWLAEAIISENLNINWKRTYFLAFLCTKETKLRGFHFKFLHRRVATNAFLHKTGLKPNAPCTFCGETTENLIHLFWNCKHSSTFWKKKPMDGYTKMLMTSKTTLSLQPYILA